MIQLIEINKQKATQQKLPVLKVQRAFLQGCLSNIASCHPSHDDLEVTIADSGTKKKQKKGNNLNVKKTYSY